MELQFAKPKHPFDIYRFEQPNDTFIATRPGLMDPHDRKNVFIGQSALTFAGEGMFARRDIPAHVMFVSYAGLYVYDENAIYHKNMTDLEREDAHKNMINFDDEIDLNVDPWMSHVENYRASLGHKVFAEIRVDRNNALKV